MDLQSPPSESFRADMGVGDSIRSLLASALLYLENRLRLAKLEGGEALRLGAGIAALAAFVLASLFIAYLGGMIALGLWIANIWWDGEVLPAALTMALVHLVVAAIGAVVLVRLSRGRSLFHATFTEFNEDRRWLHTNQKSTN